MVFLGDRQGIQKGGGCVQRGDREAYALARRKGYSECSAAEKREDQANTLPTQLEEYRKRIEGYGEEKDKLLEKRKPDNVTEIAAALGIPAGSSDTEPAPEATPDQPVLLPADATVDDSSAPISEISSSSESSSGFQEALSASASLKACFPI